MAATEAQKRAVRKYNKTEKGRVTRERYRTSEKGIQTEVEYRERNREKTRERDRQRYHRKKLFCPKCGHLLKNISSSQEGYKWEYRRYPCSTCKNTWNWARRKGDSLIEMEECSLYDPIFFADKGCCAAPPMKEVSDE